MPRRLHAFTLVELLTVIGIIGLLIAILLPAVQRVRLQVRITQCVSNQRQVVQAAVMYAMDNGGKLPLPEVPTESPVYNQRGAEPLLASFLSNGSTTSSPVLVKASPIGWGRMYASGHVKDPRIFFEPDHRNPEANYDTYNLSIGFAAPGVAPYQRVRSAYYCNPHRIVSLTSPVYDPKFNSRFPGIITNFSQAGKPVARPYNILVMDRPSLGDARRAHGYNWNIAFLDQSVQTFRSKLAENTIDDYDGTAASAVWLNWALHEQFLHALTQ